MRIKTNASRYTRETGKIQDVDLLFDLQEAAEVELVPGLPKYYFHMHNIQKIGFNLTPSYGDTPLGLYAYPLNAAYLRKLLDDTLPYRSDSPLVTILELVDPHTALVAEELVYYRKRLSHNYVTEKDRVKHFRQLLTADGIKSVFDDGVGHIHKNEPAQIVFLTSNAYKVIETFETRVIRKKTIFDIYKVIYNKPLFGISNEVWTRELALWAADCAERVLPVWEKWARTNVPEHASAYRNAIKAVREYIYGRISEEDYSQYTNAVHYANDAANDCAATNITAVANDSGVIISVANAANAITDATTNATTIFIFIGDAAYDDYIDSSAARAASSAAAAATYPNLEKLWQKQALRQRLELVALNKSSLIRSIIQ